MRLRTSLLFPVLTVTFASMLHAQQSTSVASSDRRSALHSGVDWEAIAPHLPNPQTATAKELELAGDVLMARRFPEDALEYYGYAQQHGGDPLRLLKKQGVVRLEMQQGTLARLLFARCLQLSKKDAEAWNNLAATDYSMGNMRGAVGEYKRAVKLNKQSAVFHANLGMAYVELKDMDSARVQFAQAVRLDPTIMTRRENGGVTLRILQSKDYAMLCFEMARMYAKEGNIAEMKQWLQKASDRGLDLRQTINDDATMRVWLKDPDVKAMLTSAETFHKRVANVSAPSLGAAAEPTGVPN